MRIRSILCPVDFSAVSRHAYEQALVWAARSGARLTVLHAVEPLLVHAAAVAGLDADYLRDTHAELRAFIGRPGATLPGWAPAATAEVTVGEPWKAIVAAAGAYDADLIVMGTQGTGGVRKFVFGSTAGHVLREAVMPVLAIPPAAPRRFVFESAGPRLEVGTVLAAVDFAPGSDTVTAIGAAVARALDARLVLAHAVQPYHAVGRRAPEVAVDELARATARAALESMASRLESPYPIETAIVSGRPSEALIDLAAIHGAGLLVLGTASASSRHRPGFTASRLLSLAETPVLAVPPTTALSASRELAAVSADEVW